MTYYNRPDATYPAVAEDGEQTLMSPADVGAGWSTTSQTRPPAATFNAKDWYVSSGMKYLCQIGIAQYSPDETYRGGGICLASDGSYYWNLIPSQGVDPVGDNGNTWEKLPIRLRDALGLIGVPGAPNGAVQFNSNGTFGGRDTFTYQNGQLSIGSSIIGPTADNFRTAMSVGGGIEDGARCGISCPHDYPNLYIDSRNVLVFQSMPDRWGTMNSNGLLIGGADGIYQAGHRLDICGPTGGEVVAYIDTGGNINTDGVIHGWGEIGSYGDSGIEPATHVQMNVSSRLGNQPMVTWVNAGAAGDGHIYSIGASTQQFIMSTSADDGTNYPWLTASRNGRVIERIEIYSQFKQIIGGAAIGLQGNLPLTPDLPGTWLAWNQTQGEGESDLVNVQSVGGGSAGFSWYSIAIGTPIHNTNPLMRLGSDGNLSLAGGFGASGNSSVGGQLTVLNGLNVTGQLTAWSGIVCNGNLEVGGTFVADTTITCLSDIQVNGRINGLGSAILNGTVAIPIAGKTYNTVQVGQYAGRSFNVVYQNTSSMTRQLSITYTTTGGSVGYVTANVGPTNPPTNQVFKDENTASVNGSECAITLLLPPGWFISLGSSGDVTGIGHWWEWDCP